MAALQKCGYGSEKAGHFLRWSAQCGVEATRSAFSHTSRIRQDGVIAQRQSAPVATTAEAASSPPRLVERTREEHDGSCVTAGIAIRSSRRQRALADRFDAGLLQQSRAASSTVLQCLRSLREGVGLERLIPALNKEHLAARVEQRTDRQQRRLGARWRSQGLVIAMLRPCFGEEKRLREISPMPLSLMNYSAATFTGPDSGTLEQIGLAGFRGLVFAIFTWPKPLITKGSSAKATAVS